MSSFKNNYSTFLLLSERNIRFWNEEGESFEMIPIKVEGLFMDSELNAFLNFLESDLSELQRFFKEATVATHYDWLHIMLSLHQNSKDSAEIAEIILKGFQKIIPEVIFEDSKLQVNGIFIDSILFSDIVEVIYKTLDKEKTIIREDDDEFTKMEKEAKLRAERIRNKGKKTSDKGLQIEDMFAAIIYEFPQYTVEDLFKLNIYTFYYLFKYTGKIANYEVSKIAAGNGLTKKHKYFIEK